MTDQFEVIFPMAAAPYDRRRVFVWLPDDYYTDASRRLRVLYMFDGQNVFFDETASFGRSWRMGGYMEQYPDFMVVAVESNRDPDGGRLREYAPFGFSDKMCGRVAGGGEETLTWLVEELKPMIDRNYRTLADRENTFIAGSSMGGLMSVYALLARNDIFLAAAALSPSLWAGHVNVMKMIREADVKNPTFLYMDYGMCELKNHDGMLDKFSRAAALLLKKRVLTTLRMVPEGSHNEESWEKNITYFMDMFDRL